MRIKLLSPVLAAGLVATGLALMVATPSQAAPVKLYFHSAAGSFQDDWAEDPTSFGDAAPAGSTLDAKPPTKTTDASAMAFTLIGMSSEPLSPTFSLPFAGDITTLCLDFWAISTPNPETNGMTTYTSINVEPPFGDLFETAKVDKYDGKLVRVTKMVKPDGAAKITVAKDSEFAINGDVFNPDWTMYYDSVTHPSSITINATECKATPVVVPTATASATPTATASATATPTATPSGSATATPSGTATPSVTPTVDPTTPPAPAEETTLDYTGATSGRYSDTAPVSAKVTLPDGSPVPTGSVEFVLGGVATRFPVDSSGVAAGRMPVRAGAGEQFMTVQYVANSAYLGAREQVPFAVSRMATRCAISRTTSGGNYVITGTLRDAAGRAVSGQSLLFAYNNRTWKAVRTDRNGRASVTVARKAGTHMVTLPTNAYYTGCSASLRV